MESLKSREIMVNFQNGKSFLINIEILRIFHPLALRSFQEEILVNGLQTAKFGFFPFDNQRAVSGRNQVALSLGPS